MEPENGGANASPERADPRIQPEPAESPRKSRPVLRIIGFFLVISFISMIVVGYLVYSRFLNLGTLKDFFQDKAGKALGIPVKVSELTLDFPTVKLSGIQLGDPAQEALPFAEIGLVNVNPDFWDLVKGNVVIESLYVSSASVRIVRNASGVLALGESLGQGSRPMGEPSTRFDPNALPVGSIELENLSLAYVDRLKGRSMRFSVAKAELKKSVLGGSMPFSAEAALETVGSISISGGIQPSGVIKASFKAGPIALSGVRDLIPYLPRLPSGVASPTLGAEVEYSLSGALGVSRILLTCSPGLRVDGAAVFESFSPVSASGSFSFSPVAVEVLLPLIKPYISDLKGIVLKDGQLGGGVRFQIAGGAMASLDAWVQPRDVNVQVPQLPKPVSLDDGRFRYGNGTLTWENLKLSAPGLQVSSEQGRLAFDKETSAGVVLQMSIQTGPFFQYLKAMVPKSLSQFSPSGNLNFKGKADYQGKNLAIDGKLIADGVSIIPQSGAQTVVFENAEFQAEKLGVSSGRISILKCQAKAMNTTFQVRGQIINGTDPQFSVVASADIDLAKLQAALPIENDLFKKKTKLSGKANLQVALGGSVKKPNPVGIIDIKGAEISLSDRNLTVTGITGVARGDLRSLLIDKLTAKIAGAKIQAQCLLTNLLDPSIDAKATLSGINLGEVRVFLATNFPTFPKGLEFGGRSDLEFSLSGKASQPDLKGSALLAGATLDHPAMLRRLDNLVGPVQFDNVGLKTEGLQADWGSSTIHLKGKIDSWAAFGLDFAYDIEPLDLTDIGRFFLSGTGYASTGRGNALGKLAGPIEKFVLSGTAKIPLGGFEAPVSKGATTFKFPFQDLTAPFTFSQKMLVVQGAQLKMFGGLVQASGKVFCGETPIRFEFQSKGSGVQAAAFLSENTKFKDVLSGGVDLTFNAQGNTNGLLSLDGLSTVLMKTGKYKAPPVAAEIFQTLNAPNLAAGDINNLAGSFKFLAGKMTSDDLLVKSPFGQLAYKGTVGLDTSLAGIANLVLTHDVCQTSPLLKQLVGNRKTLELPVGVKGSLLSPSINLNLEKLLKKAVEEQVKQRAQELLVGVLSGGNNQTGGSASGAAEIASGSAQPKPFNVGNVLEQELGKILGGGQKPVPQPTPANPPGGAPPTQPATAPAPAPQPAQPKNPVKKLEKDLKDAGKTLKHLFKW